MTILEEIAELKAKRKALILAHNYTKPEIQDIADFVGDSLELSRKAAECTAPVIVFCGVRFMAETAKILSPGSIVLHPNRSPGVRWRTWRTRTPSPRTGRNTPRR